MLPVIADMKKKKKEDPIESIFLKMRDKLYTDDEKPISLPR